MTFLNQAIHLLKNDLLRFRLPLLAIGVIIGAHVSGFWPDSGMGGLGSRIPIGLLPLVLGALAVVAVQRDSPFDDRAFWTTRPVDPSAMLAAKLAFVSLLVAVPVAVEAIWFASLGAGSDVAPMMLDSAVLLAVVVFGAAACGAMTRSLRGGLASAVGLFVVASFVRRGIAMDLNSLETGVRVSQMFLERSAWVVIGLGVVTHQYLTRDTKRSLGLALLAITIALPLARKSSINLTTPLLAEHAPERTARWEHADDLELHLVNLRVDQHRGFNGPALRDGLAATIAFEGGSGALLSVTSSQSRIETAGADDVVPPPVPGRRAEAERLGWRFVRPSIEGMTLAAGRAPVSTQVRSWIAVNDHPRNPERVVDRVREGDHLILEIEFDAFEPRVVTTLEAATGATAALPDGEELIVQTVEASPRTIRVEVGHRWQARHLLAARVPAPLREELSFALRSRKYNEFIMDTGGSGRGRSYSVTGGATLFEPSRWLEFEAKFAEGRSGTRLPADWFEDVELVVLEAEYAGSFTKTITREIAEWPRGQVPVTVDGYPPS